MKQNGLCLIAGMMCNGNIIIFKASAFRLKRRITETASTFLNALPCSLRLPRNVDRDNRKRNPESVTKPAAKGGIGKRLLAANSMLNVKRRESNPLRLGEFG
jgi:hypothetical protein